jgi:disulfide bond formation protein DsbB
MIKMINKLYQLTFNNILEIAWLASLLMLGGAYGFEYIGGLFPCDLCWPQRYAHMAVIVFGGFALYMRKIKNPRWLRFKIMTTFSYMVSTGYSGYHSGVEQKWWEGPDSCTLQTSDLGMTMESFMRSLDSVAFVRCDEIPWDLFGISMAGYNFIISLTLVVMLSLSVVKDMKK